VRGCPWLARTDGTEQARERWMILVTWGGEDLYSFVFRSVVTAERWWFRNRTRVLTRDGLQGPEFGFYPL
jgi:hypothetical protein